MGEKCSTLNSTTASINDTASPNSVSTHTLTGTTSPVPPRPRSQEGESAMSVAAVGGIVAGALLAVLLGGVLVVVMVIIQCRRKRRQPNSEHNYTYC